MLLVLSHSTLCKNIYKQRWICYFIDSQETFAVAENSMERLLLLLKLHHIISFSYSMTMNFHALYFACTHFESICFFLTLPVFFVCQRANRVVSLSNLNLGLGYISVIIDNCSY